MDWITLQPKYRATKPRIAAIAVWDTVGALGIPQLADGGDERLDLLRFTDTRLSLQVDHGFHAIAVDEERVDFTPTLWDPDPTRIRQCFFPGAHADVGGGYPLDESLLSDHSLEWMATQLASLNIQFTKDPPIPAVDGALGPMHRPWTSPGFSLRPHDIRKFPDYAGPRVPIEVDPALQGRIRQRVLSISATVPVTSDEAPYLPLSLIRAGYVDISGVKIKSD
jgi:hypothetical protein